MIQKRCGRRYGRGRSNQTFIESEPLGDQRELDAALEKSLKGEGKNKLTPSKARPFNSLRP